MPYIASEDYPGRKHKCSMRLLRICQDNKLRKLSDFSKMTYQEVLALPECGDATAMFVKSISINMDWTSVKPLGEEVDHLFGKI